MGRELMTWKAGPFEYQLAFFLFPAFKSYRVQASRTPSPTLQVHCPRVGLPFPTQVVTPSPLLPTLTGSKRMHSSSTPGALAQQSTCTPSSAHTPTIPMNPHSWGERVYKTTTYYTNEARDHDLVPSPSRITFSYLIKSICILLYSKHEIPQNTKSRLKKKGDWEWKVTYKAGHQNHSWFSSPFFSF